MLGILMDFDPFATRQRRRAESLLIQLQSPQYLPGSSRMDTESEPRPRGNLENWIFAFRLLCQFCSVRSYSSRTRVYVRLCDVPYLVSMYSDTIIPSQYERSQLPRQVISCNYGPMSVSEVFTTSLADTDIDGHHNDQTRDCAQRRTAFEMEIESLCKCFCS